jgi:rod shape determining protein RodA
MVIGLLPVVGMPLPLISQGGSSLISFYIAFGIIISMASHKKLVPR